MGGNGARMSSAQHTVHQDGPAKWLLHSDARGGGEVDIGGHDGVRVLEIALVSPGGHFSSSAGLNGSLSFDVALANNGEGQETVAHLQAGSSHDEVLEDLIIELGGDDGHADGRQSRVGGQEAGTNAACHLWRWKIPWRSWQAGTRHQADHPHPQRSRYCIVPGS